MKQKFRDTIPKGTLKTKYWIDKSAGRFEYWYAEARTLIYQIKEVVEYYQSIDIKLTNRQLYYQLVGKDLIPNALEIYKKICNILTDLRYAGIIDWSAIEDIARTPKKKPEWDSIADIVASAIRQYRLPRWQDQEFYIEMYCEKEAGINVLSTISEKYHMYFGFNKGYSSASAMYDLAKRIKIQMEDEKKVVILYFGDHDPSGLDMIRDITDRINEFLGIGILTEDKKETLEDLFWNTEHENPKSHWYKSYEYEWKEYFEDEFIPDHLDELNETPGEFKVIPVALTREQVNEYKLPPNPAKITDPRAKWYIKKYGKISWELDAINALELRRIAEEAVLEYIDMDKYNSWIQKEDKQKKQLEKFAKSLDKEDEK